jgi:hypothetical protein
MLKRNRIFGAVGIVWGGAVLARQVMGGGGFSSGAYGAGQVVGLLTGAALFCAGLYYFIKSFQQP